MQRSCSCLLNYWFSCLHSEEMAPFLAKTLKHFVSILERHIPFSIPLDVIYKCLCICRATCYLINFWKTIIFRSKWSRFKSLALHHDDLWMYLEEYFIFINNVYSDLYMPCTVLPWSHAKICGCFGAFLSVPLLQNVTWGPNTTTLPWSFPKASIVSHTMTFFGVLLGCWPKPQESPLWKEHETLLSVCQLP